MWYWIVQFFVFFMLCDIAYVHLLSTPWWNMWWFLMLRSLLASIIMLRSLSVSVAMLRSLSANVVIMRYLQLSVIMSSSLLESVIRPRSFPICVIFLSSLSKSYIVLMEKDFDYWFDSMTLYLIAYAWLAWYLRLMNLLFMNILLEFEIYIFDLLYCWIVAIKLWILGPIKRVLKNCLVGMIFFSLTPFFYRFVGSKPEPA